LPLEPAEYEESQPRSHALAWERDVQLAWPTALTKNSPRSLAPAWERDVQPLCGEWHVAQSVEKVPYSWE